VSGVITYRSRSIENFKSKHQTAIYDWWKGFLEKPASGYHKNITLKAALAENELSDKADQLAICIIEQGLVESKNRRKRSSLFYDKKDAHEVLNRAKRGWNPFEDLEEAVGKKIYHAVVKPVKKSVKKTVERAEEKIGKKIYHGVKNGYENLEEKVGKKIYHGVKDGYENLEEKVGKKIYHGVKDGYENLEEKVGKKIYHGVKDGWENLEENVGKKIYHGAKKLSWENLEENIGKKIYHGVKDGWENLEENVGKKIYHGAKNNLEKLEENVGKKIFWSWHALTNSNKYQELQKEIQNHQDGSSVVETVVDVILDSTYDALFAAHKTLNSMTQAFGHPISPLVSDPLPRLKRSTTRRLYFNQIEYDIKNKLDPIKNYGIVDPIRSAYKLAFLSNYNNRQKKFADYERLFYNSSYLPEFKPCFQEFYSSLSPMIFNRFYTVFPDLNLAFDLFCMDMTKDYGLPLPQLCEFYKSVSRNGFRADIIEKEEDRQKSWDSGLDTFGQLYSILDLQNDYTLDFDRILKVIVDSKIDDDY